MTAAFDPLAYPDKLNLGCGFDHREGYLNVDFQHFHEPDLVADVTDLHMLPDERYTEIVAQDVLEHLPRMETQAVLGEWNRIAAPGCSLVLRVPSLVDLVRLFERSEFQGPAEQELLLQSMFGTQAYTGDFHYTSFTRPLLAHYLAQEGFKTESWELYDEWLFDIVARKVGPSRFVTEFAHLADVLRIEDHDTFLDTAYERVLGREPDEMGRAFHARQLREGTASRRTVLQVLIHSPEAAGRSAV